MKRRREYDWGEKLICRIHTKYNKHTFHVNYEYKITMINDDKRQIQLDSDIWL